YMLHLPNLPTAPRGFWLGVTGLGLLGAALLAVALTRVSWSPARPALSLVAAAAFLYTALLVTAGFFDRYLIVLCALAVMPAGVAASRPRHSGRLRLVATGLSGGLLLAYGAFAAAGTHDYFAWNRARWRAIDDAVRSRGIPVTGFDGGYEWNGPNRYTPTTPWWWADREPWVLTFGPVAGYEEVARYAFRRWLPPGEGAVLLLRRADP
ncbi:MAG TPA: hypothetical protein VIC87_13560, partial [Vicinamibacteria bacterium]